MQRQGFLQAFLQAGCRRPVDQPQLLPETDQRGPGFGVRRKERNRVGLAITLIVELDGMK
jgi:hypothetical protein